MATKNIITRKGNKTSELNGIAKKTFKGITLEYPEVYYLDYAVNENTGLIDTETKEKFYTKDQVERNIKSLKNAYYIAKGSVAPKEIISFRKQYKIAASTLSLVLGFSKNTISNIENEGITSLSSGRLIKMCLNNKSLIRQYIQLCDAIDKSKKEKLFKRLME